MRVGKAAQFRGSGWIPAPQTNPALESSLVAPKLHHNLEIATSSPVYFTIAYIHCVHLLPLIYIVYTPNVVTLFSSLPSYEQWLGND